MRNPMYRNSGNGGNGGSSSHGSPGGVGGIWSHIQFPQLPPLPPFTMTNTLLGPDEAMAEEPDPLAARRAATGKRLYALASTVAELVQTVDTEDWQMPAWRRYERLQRAHEALYTALGGVRMGDYRPTQAKLDEAVASVLLWALLTLDAVER